MQNVSFLALFKNPILEVTSTLGVTLKNFILGFWESLYMRGSQEKILGQKVNVKFFRVDPYTLGNRIPRAFQNLSDLHIWCRRENFYIGFLPKYFLGVTTQYMWGGNFWGKILLGIKCEFWPNLGLKM